MKKAALLHCYLLAALYAFGKIPPNIQKLTLNNFTYQQAVDMRVEFENNNTDANTKTNCIWFRAAVIKEMIALMSTERGPNGEPVDGVRIYYGSVGNQNTVILVSTYYDGIASNGLKKHHDYFDHDSNNQLFKETDVNGIPSDKGLNEPGAELYKLCNFPCQSDLLCKLPAGATHYITHHHAAEMVVNLATVADVPNGRSEWFPLCVFNSIDAKYNGIRIYYGKHLSSDALLGNRDTFVMELTVLIDGYNKDSFDCTFAQCDVTNLTAEAKKYIFRGQFKSKEKFLARLKSLKRYFFTNGLDNGELCPNHCQGSTLP